nr:immunoglobulin heavy chain junction region [Macaca mulatta]MOX94811.1 immunoglobulin heavy chain junction region [Macaca mulatta]MOX95672.1 immunoglobulin heavy chain junction region [Macaca mulatta]MOX96128.1 immunoglobulin heavy chain junction region [Macaca mulatta]
CGRDVFGTGLDYW